MFCSEDEKEIIKSKWIQTLTKSCEICNGTRFIEENGRSKMCECYSNALKYAELECANIPISSFNYKKETLEMINYNIKDYFNNIINSVYNVKSLYLYNLPYKVNNDLIGIISKNLVNKKNLQTTNKVVIYYEIFENLVQLSLRPSNDFVSKNKLNQIINCPNILFLDDVGSETGFNMPSKPNLKLLQLILKERQNKVKSTIIISKKPISELPKLYNEEVFDIISTFDLIKLK